MPKKSEKYIQIGQTALRSPNGDFLPAVPLFIREQDAGLCGVSGRSIVEELDAAGITKMLASKYKQYKDGTAANVKGGDSVREQGTYGGSVPPEKE